MVNLRFWKRQKADASKRRIGPYVVQREIGRGSMGVVYLATDPVSRRDVAIKAMALAEDFDEHELADIKARFVRETTILSWLDHQDIVTIHDFGEERGLAYFVMEFIKGVELARHVRRGKLLPLPKTLEIVARVADALGHAHEQNITHRDVKPANIMYDASSNMVKVMDFGISRLSNFSMTQRDVVLGSPVYMSPEQVIGGDIDGRSDLFSLGTTLYQLVSGRLPFSGGSELEVMRRIAEGPHTDVLSVRPDLPPPVADVINRALVKDLAGRYQSAYDMAEDVRRCARALQQAPRY